MLRYALLALLAATGCRVGRQRRRADDVRRRRLPGRGAVRGRAELRPDDVQPDPRQRPLPDRKLRDAELRGWGAARLHRRLPRGPVFMRRATGRLRSPRLRMRRVALSGPAPASSRRKAAWPAWLSRPCSTGSAAPPRLRESPEAQPRNQHGRRFVWLRDGPHDPERTSERKQVPERFDTGEGGTRRQPRAPPRPGSVNDTLDAERMRGLVAAGQMNHTRTDCEARAAQSELAFGHESQVTRRASPHPSIHAPADAARPCGYCSWSAKCGKKRGSGSAARAD